MSNYRKYYIALRLLLLKQFFEANAGQHRYVRRSELEDLMKEMNIPVEKKSCTIINFQTAFADVESPLLILIFCFKIDRILCCKIGKKDAV